MPLPIISIRKPQIWMAPTIVVALQIPKEVAEDEINKKLKTSQWKFESSRC